MINLRKNSDRGKSALGWLDSYHTFSFSNYFDPKFMGFGSLRVINEDTVQPSYGFNKHSHEHMEIISYVIDGLLEHRDSLGNGSVIKRGEIQKMSAGTGIEHSEFNPSQTKPLHFLQIWVQPNSKSIIPSYEQKNIPQEINKLILIGSPEGNNNAILIHQPIKLFVSYMTKNFSLEYQFEKNSLGWIQLIKGKLSINNQLFSAGDGASMKNEDRILMTCLEDAEFLLFDLAT